MTSEETRDSDERALDFHRLLMLTGMVDAESPEWDAAGRVTVLGFMTWAALTEMLVSQAVDDSFQATMIEMDGHTLTRDLYQHALTMPEREAVAILARRYGDARARYMEQNATTSREDDSK